MFREELKTRKGKSEVSYLTELLGSAYKENMSEDELSKAIEKAVAAREKQAEGELSKIKNAFNKASSEVADYKHKLQERMSEDEKTRAEQAELLEKLQAENAEFKRASVIADNTAKLVAIGYGEELASKTAQALADGDTASVFASFKTVLEGKEKDLRASLMKETPIPPAGAGAKPMTRDEIMAIKDTETRQQAIAQNPSLFGL